MDSDDWEKKSKSDRAVKETKQQNQNKNENYQYHGK